MRIAIYGAGSLGTVLGAYITKAGIPVDLVNRNVAHITALREHGATVTGTVNLNIPVTALFPDEMPGGYDIIFLLTKVIDNRAVVRFLSDKLAPDGVICTMQNGLPELPISEIVGAKRTFGCTIAWGATLLSPGVCELTSEPDAISFGLGSFGGGNDEKFTAIKSLLETMGVVETEENFIGSRWAKLLINAAFSGMSAVLGATFGEVNKNPSSRLCAQKIIKEVLDTAAALNIRIEKIQGKDVAKLLDYHSEFKRKLAFMIIPIAMKKHKHIKASMLQDLEKGKKCEIDAINGVVCEYGAKAGVPTPYNDKVVELVKEIENGNLKPSFGNLRFFD
ncbi:MAG: 2-dehydropantoate 2-reductase [Clostridiaceae bacterium]|jgi:2-dehydropantoate 2-reductase|nr:2-dehydropantoate 2-reductase [Clostridiaceae bacterium]